jgi:hypothetical protein
MARSGCSLSCVLFVAATVPALDPNKNAIQNLRKPWRIRAWSLPAGISAMTQCWNGIPWFEFSNREFCRFHGVRLEHWDRSGVDAEVRFTHPAAFDYEQWRHPEMERGHQ